ncbi:uncharacterized protein LAESUDRAFT_191758 [Laetiporus sulphureus 93-53]|uniref:Uncharacterized protein n=1 Tax=Laetiporus sulphureus 93-53 TaxID=1314785 RepID=A0A165E6N5_9APHY|nr:uncharacterized protein LAESUDRAFT_191758 [Laetiporus sulphureus 93-53]KZT06342.1 hypothetical protein LAESUDRAFT_191758 [Laetiporus sulphureus 93-53]
MLAVRSRSRSFVARANSHPRCSGSDPVRTVSATSPQMARSSTLRAPFIIFGQTMSALTPRPRSNLVEKAKDRSKFNAEFDASRTELKSQLNRASERYCRRREIAEADAMAAADQRPEQSHRSLWHAMLRSRLSCTSALACIAEGRTMVRFREDFTGKDSCSSRNRYLTSITRTLLDTRCSLV